MLSDQIKNEIIINEKCRDRSLSGISYRIFNDIVNANLTALNNLKNIDLFKNWDGLKKPINTPIEHANNDEVLRDILLELLDRLKKRKELIKQK